MTDFSTDFSIFECFHLTGPEVDFAIDVWEFLESPGLSFSA